MHAGSYSGSCPTVLVLTGLSFQPAKSLSLTFSARIQHFEMRTKTDFIRACQFHICSETHIYFRGHNIFLHCDKTFSGRHHSSSDNSLKDWTHNKSCSGLTFSHYFLSFLSFLHLDTTLYRTHRAQAARGR